MRILSPLVITIALLLGASPAFAARYDFDKSHTRILFFISHLGFSNMSGWFRDYDGYFDFDEQNPEAGKVEVTVYPKSVDTGHDGLNQHLQKKEFFNTEAFPEVKFKSTKVKVLKGNKGMVIGDLTMLGVTKPIALDVTFNKAGKHPLTQDYVAGFTAQGVIKRSDFGMNYGLPDMLGDTVELHIEVEGIDHTPRIPEKKH